MAVRTNLLVITRYRLSNRKNIDTTIADPYMTEVKKYMGDVRNSREAYISSNFNSYAIL